MRHSPMVKPGPFCVDQALKDLRQAHQHIRVVLPVLEKISSPASPSEVEDAVFGLFRHQTEVFYAHVVEYLRSIHKPTGMIEGLRKELSILKLQTLEYIDGAPGAQLRLGQDLKIRIQLEEDYLIPVLSEMANHNNEGSNLV